MMWKQNVYQRELKKLPKVTILQELTKNVDVQSTNRKDKLYREFKESQRVSSVGQKVELIIY